MIARIFGTLISKSVQQVVVDTQGVGYRIVVPLTTFYDLPEEGELVTLHIYTHVKEDAISLFGFLTPGEREIFQVMISVSGIGPKLGLNILSGISPAELMTAIVQGDLRRLVAIPGVGKKMAERLILELKDKVHKMPPAAAVSPQEIGARQMDVLMEDALSALINLGYKQGPAKEALDRVLEDSTAREASLNEVLKGALKILAG
jgi:Holliday junction DNA helicase RuvA